MGCHFLLQEIFPSRGLSPGLLHCRQTFYHLSHQGSILQSLKQSRKYLILALLLDFFHQREFIIDHVSEIDQFSSVQLSRSVVSDSLWSHGLQHARSPCPSPTPRAYSNSCPLNQWCHTTISSSVIHFSFHLQSFPASEFFSSDSVLRIRWPKCWSFSFIISPSNEYLGLISFRMDQLDLLSVQGTLKSLLQYHSSKASVLRHSAVFIVQLSHPYMTTGKTKALTRVYWQSNVSSF